MSGKRFILLFFASEASGFAIGAPIASAYALLLISIGPEKIPPIISAVLIAVAAIVFLGAVPANLYLTHGLKNQIDSVYRDTSFQYNNAIGLLQRLHGLAILHGTAIFIRVSIGAVLVAAYMHIGLAIPVIQSVIAGILAIYGAFLAGLVAFFFVTRIVRPIAKRIIEQQSQTENPPRIRKFFGLSYVHHTILFLIIPIICTNLTVLLTILANIANNDFQTLLIKIIGVCIVNIITLAGTVLMNILSVRGKLKRLLNGISLFADNSGDLTTRIDTDLSDDFEYINYLMNQSIGNFGSLLQTVGKASDMLFDSTQNLSVASKEISTTANEQSASVKEIVSTTEDSNSLVKQIQNHVQEMADGAHNTRKEVESGTRSLADSSSQMELIRENHQNTIDEMRKLESSLDNIGEILSIINSIAEQTKIIAFNAELEAASAGAAGESFEIVANEIRRLADSTTGSTKKIKDTLQAIQYSSSTLIKSSEKSSEAIHEGLRFTKEEQKVFSEIQNSAENSAEKADRIQRSIDQQASSSDQILTTLKQISEGVDHFVSSTQTISEYSESLDHTARELKSIVDRFKVG